MALSQSALNELVGASGDCASLTHLRFRPRVVLEHVTGPPRVWSVDEQKAG
jgi:hypothetical protein